jgi:hypothetical protein
MWYHVWKEEVVRESLTWRILYRYKIYLGLMYVHRKQVPMADVLGHELLNITFCGTLTGNKWFKWLHLVNRLMQVELSNDQDTFVWSLTSYGSFTIKFIYLDLMNDHTRYL